MVGARAERRLAASGSTPTSGPASRALCRRRPGDRPRPDQQRHGPRRGRRDHHPQRSGEGSAAATLGRIRGRGRSGRPRGRRSHRGRGSASRLPSERSTSSRSPAPKFSTATTEPSALARHRRRAGQSGRRDNIRPPRAKAERCGRPRPADREAPRPRSVGNAFEAGDGGLAAVPDGAAALEPADIDNAASEARCAVRKQLQPNLALHPMRAGHRGQRDALVGHANRLKPARLFRRPQRERPRSNLRPAPRRIALGLGSRLLRSLRALSGSVLDRTFRGLVTQIPRPELLRRRPRPQPELPRPKPQLLRRPELLQRLPRRRALRQRPLQQPLPQLAASAGASSATGSSAGVHPARRHPRWRLPARRPYGDPPRRALGLGALETDPERTNPLTARYLNRLSDLLFILGRVANPDGDVLWRPGGPQADDRARLTARTPPGGRPRRRSSTSAPRTGRSCCTRRPGCPQCRSSEQPRPGCRCAG